MTNHIHSVAELLRECRHSLAELVCYRLQSPHGVDAHNALHARHRVAHAEATIHVLAASMAFDSIPLLEDFLRWSGSISPAVSDAHSETRHMLEELASIVHLELPEQMSMAVSGLIRHVLEGTDATATNGSEQETSRGTFADVQERYLSLLLESRRSEALQLVLQLVEEGASIESLYMEVLQPSLIEVGRLWQEGKVSVTQEHYCTAATQFVMAHLQPYFLTNNKADQRIVATCVGNELHEVGLRIVADMFEMWGWSTVYLGANVPAESVANSLVVNRAQVLALSATMTEHLFEVSEVVGVVRKHPDCQHVKIIVGGHPFNVEPRLGQRLGADGYAPDAMQAIRIAGQLLDSSGKVRGSRGATTKPIVSVATTTGAPAAAGTHDDLSRLNNSLITVQRELNQANVKLAALNKANEEKAAALQEADRRKDEFLAMLAHELRGPLAPMQFAVALLQDPPLDAQVQAQATATLSRQIEQMTHLINDLLDASRITHGKIELQRETVDLKTTLERAIEIVRPLIDEKRQTLHIEHTSSPIFVRADTIRLTQVVANLLTNAAKYTDEGGKIWLSSRRRHDQAEVVVRDSGTGIEATNLPHIFTAFSQEQRSKDHSRGGLGLGLSLVKQLVELHGGEVKVASDGPGKGTVFSFRLPALDFRSAERSQLRTDRPKPHLFHGSVPSRRVLVVEDVRGLAQIAVCLLEQLGHKPFVAANGETAVKMYGELLPEIVLLDLMLPDMTGFEVARAIRARASGRSVLIVAMTGHSDAEHQRLATESGCDLFLVKPVDVRVLKELATHPKLMLGHRDN